MSTSKLIENDHIEIRIFNEKVKKRIRREGQKLKRKIKGYQVVPWAYSEEWDFVCELFHCGNYQALLRKINFWKLRVTKLPIGVEGTLHLILAFDYESKHDLNYPENKLIACSLYSMAIIRFLNQVSHLVSKSVGGLTLTMSAILSQANIPEWMVELRHNATHGSHLPSLDSLKYAATFIKDWLQVNYWIKSQNGIVHKASYLGMSNVEVDDVQDELEEDIDSPELVSERAYDIVAAYTASRIYQIRKVENITDQEIIKFWPPQTKSVKTKVAIKTFKHSINQAIHQNPKFMSKVLSNEMIPTVDFYKSFAELFDSKPFAKWKILWLPIVKMLIRRNMLGILCESFAEIHGFNESIDHAKRFSALWIKFILKLIIQRNDYNDKLLLQTKVLPLVMKSLNPYSQLFLKSLLVILKKRIDIQTLKKLELLGKIWLTPLNSEIERKSSLSVSDQNTSTYVELDGILSEPDRKKYKLDLEAISNDELKPSHWLLNSKGPSFWCKLSLDAIQEILHPS